MVRKNRYILSLVIAVTAIVIMASCHDTAIAEPIAVVVNIDNTENSLSVKQIRRFYQNSVLNWPNGKRVKLYDLADGSDVYDYFCMAVMDKRGTKVRMEWSNKAITNTAVNPPTTLKSHILLQSRISKDPSAIGYLPLSKVVHPKLKIVATIDYPN